MNAGLLALGIGTGLLLVVAEQGSPSASFSWAVLLLGFGAGASVSPGLFLAAFGVPSQSLGRAFALVELLRSEAGYAVAPVVAAIAQGSATLADGVRTGLVVTLVLTALGLLVALVLPAVSGARLRAPDLAGWLAGEGKALPSPATATHLRPSIDDEDADRCCLGAARESDRGVSGLASRAVRPRPARPAREPPAAQTSRGWMWISVPSGR